MDFVELSFGYFLITYYYAMYMVLGWRFNCTDIKEELQLK